MADKIDMQDALIAELMVRVSTIEKLLIDNKLITLEAYNVIFKDSVDKIMNLLEKQSAETISGALKH